MRRYFESLRPADCPPFTRFRTGSSWSASIEPSTAGTSRSLIYEIRFAVLEPRHSDRVFHDRARVLHTQGNVEAALVPARFRL